MLHKDDKVINPDVWKDKVFKNILLGTKKAESVTVAMRDFSIPPVMTTDNKKKLLNTRIYT